MSTMLTRLALGTLALALAACNGEAPTDTGSTNDDTGNDDTSSRYLYPTVLQMQGGFAYVKVVDNDVPANNVDEMQSYQVPLATGTAVLDPFLLVTLNEVIGSGPSATLEVTCEILIRQAGPIAPGTLNDGAVTKGFLFDWTSATIEHDCDGLLDPAAYGDDLTASFKTVTYGLGISGAVAANLATTIESQVDAAGGDYDADWKPYLFGARPYLSTTGALANGANEFFFATASEIDTTTTPATLKFVDANANDLLEDNEETVPLLAADIVASGPVTGAYSIQGGVSFSDENGDPLTLDALLVAPAAGQ